VSEEHGRDGGDCLEGTEQRRAERVQRLLAGERLDTAELSYGLEGFHLGLVATGAGAEDAVRGLAESLDHRLLLIRRDEGGVWAWLGGRRLPEPDRVHAHLDSDWPAGAAAAIGEPGQGPGGWRLSHRQAQAALPIALRGSERLVRYADVALLATMLQDDLLATSLRQLYLSPLECQHDGGEVLRGTLRAYFAAERNVSSTAAALGVNRKTVTSRLRAIESMIGSSFASHAAEVEAALRLEELGRPVLPHSALPH
jgi:PucR C-terminal helix-turn-helix domain/GGDEF-like domain